MSGPSVTGLAPILVLLVILATDYRIYPDAKAQSDNGIPVFFSIGTFQVATPAAWLVVCLFLWIVFLPLYLTARGR